MTSADPSAARRYHGRTKHSFQSVRASPPFLDWDIMPRPFKVYPDVEPISLPGDVTTSTRPALAAIADAGAVTGTGPQLDRTALSRLFYFSAGVLRRTTYPGGEMFYRAAACTGALYHIDLYLVCGSLPDLDPGVYHFGPHDFALRRLRAGDHRETVIRATGREPAATAAPALVLFTSTFWRNSWKYQARAYRHCFWDSGTILANLLGLAAAVELPARVILGFVDDDFNRLLDLDPAREVTLGVVALGRGGAPPPAAPPLPPLGLATLPPSAREVDYPAIREAHAESCLTTPDEAAAWHGSAAPSPDEAAGLSLGPWNADAVAAPIETVIRRRGSMRAFSDEPLGFDQLSALLRAVTRGIPADFTAPGAALSDPYLIVNAADGIEPGTYVFDRRRNVLVPLRAGTFRREAGFLDLGQSLAAKAALNVYWLTDLERALTRFGNRGYRAAQLEAAIEGGKAYLAAYALGLGATGLTFFDDDVTAFFSPHAAGKSVMFLVAIGPGRRRS